MKKNERYCMYTDMYTYTYLKKNIYIYIYIQIGRQREMSLRTRKKNTINNDNYYYWQRLYIAPRQINVSDGVLATLMLIFC